MKVISTSSPIVESICLRLERFTWIFEYSYECIFCAQVMLILLIGYVYSRHRGIIALCLFVLMMIIFTLYSIRDFRVPNDFIQISWNPETHNISSHISSWGTYHCFGAHQPLRNMYLQFVEHAIQDYASTHRLSIWTRPQHFYIVLHDAYRVNIEDDPTQPWVTSGNYMAFPLCQHLNAKPNEAIRFDFPVLTANAHKNDPSSTCIPDFYIARDHGMDKLLVQMGNAFQEPWEQRRPQVVWRGAVNGRTRPELFRNRLEWDTAATQRYMNIVLITDFNRHDRLSIAEQCHFQFQLDMDGVTNAWDALRWKLASGSVVIKLRSNWYQWFYSHLIDGTHYVGIDSMNDLVPCMLKLMQQPDLCKQIANHARTFALSHFSYEQCLRDMGERITHGLETF